MPKVVDTETGVIAADAAPLEVINTPFIYSAVSVVFAAFAPE